MNLIIIYVTCRFRKEEIARYISVGVCLCHDDSNEFCPRNGTVVGLIDSELDFFSVPQPTSDRSGWDYFSSLL
jgi:hypothetical protein